MSKYIPTIGLEIHAELKTQTKMFCDCLNNPDEKHPNANICPICLGHPGTLPTINKAAVEAVLKLGMALRGDIPQFSKFDRKNYFYPDLPKGYQISQYDMPLIFGGVLNGVRLRRIHLEEDTARLAHGANLADLRGLDADHAEKGQRSQPKSARSASLVDFNRAGVPLMELVTEPDVKNAAEAVEFARELQLILRYLGISDADMEKGQMRVEANISLMVTNSDSRILANEIGENSRLLGTKVEIKNINSFKAVRDAIEYELKRQEELLEKGEKIKQETRGWDDNKKVTVSQRSKEEAHDYRYFPEPDLPPLALVQFKLGELERSLPELPKEKRVRLMAEYNFNAEQADVLTLDRQVADYFEKATSELKTFVPNAGPKEYQLTLNYLTNDLFGLLSQQGMTFAELKLTPENFAELVAMIITQKINSRTAKDILPKLLSGEADPHELVESGGLLQVSNVAELQVTAKMILDKNPQAIVDYKKGKTSALQFLVGKTMAELKGSGNPAVLQEIFKKLLG